MSAGMAAEAGQLLRTAWQHFDAGDKARALQAARQAWDDAASPPAAAALGYFLLDAGQDAAAQAVLQTALAHAPRHAPLHWYLGLLHQRVGRPEQAADALRRACLLDPQLDEAAFALAWTLHDLGQWQEAQGWAQKALRAARQPQRVLQLGWLRQCLGQPADAAALYEEAITAFAGSAPEQSRLHLHLAQCRLALRQPEQAEQALRDGLARRPHDHDLTAALVWQMWDADRVEHAIALATAHADAQPAQPHAWHLLGVLHHRTGALAAADDCLARAQQHAPVLLDVLWRRAQIQSSLGHPETAHTLLAQVLAQEPHAVPARALMSQVLLNLQRPHDARRHLLALLREQPAEADLRRLLAVAHLQLGRRQRARRLLAHTLRLDPENVEALRTLGWLALEQGDLAVAEDAARRLLGRVPEDVVAKIQASFIFAASGDFARAEVLACDAVSRDMHNAEAWRALSQVRYRQHRLSEAEHAIQHALRLQPDRLDSLRQLGWIQIADRRLAQADETFVRVRDLAPASPVSLLEQAEVKLRAGDFRCGLERIDTLLATHPGHVPGQLLQARLLAESAGQPGDGPAEALALCRQLLRHPAHLDETARILARLVGLNVAGAEAAFALLPRPQRLRALRDALATASHGHGYGAFQQLAAAAVRDFPQDAWIAAAALYAASLTDATDPAALQVMARDGYRALKLRGGLARAHAPTLPRLPGARPRIAYVAGQQHWRLLRRTLAHHDPAQAEVFVYTNRPDPGLPPHLHFEPLVLETLADSFAANGIDVLIDAGGLHPFEGQLGLLEAYARRLAPLQVGWLGCWGTAGGLFDVLLADEHAIPPAHDAHHEEIVWRLAGGQWSWDPPLHAPEPAAALPSAENGFVTFGVTARGLRLAPAVITVWGRILAALPGSQIRFVGEIEGDWPQRQEVLGILQSQGVDATRVAFDPPCSYEKLLAWCQRIDLVLDPFPGNGGLSLFDPLWMGVPVVSRAGHWAGARQAASVLAALGLDHWVAETADAYVDTALALARDDAARSRDRSTLRARLSAAPLVDGRRMARQIEQWCARFVDTLSEADDSPDPKARVRAQARRALHGWLDKSTELLLPTVPAGTQPDLSVIVILYNQAGLSRQTLQALADQRGPMFETLIVDNASDDETARLLARVRGAHIIANPTNVGFLLAANQAAAQASGRHLVFLNSDAILQPGALAAACTRLDAEPAIGALGGRIVLTRGGLQEAGNAIFRDGTTLGIGRDEDPFCAAALASRATDYVSGVFLAVPATLWRLLDGFDETFAPAYYEDTDFCVRVWQAGFRVVYDPAILVEHLEWGSAASDEAPRRMQDNRRRFLQRHRDWLQQQPAPARRSLQGDRWQSPEDRPRRPRVLIIDNEVPHMVRGGGLPRARLMLQALRDWPVTFFPLWTLDDDWRDIYASLPSSIEVALGHGLAGLEAFLEQRRGLYDILVVSRPPNLQALGPLRRRRADLFAGMRLMYDAEALFALREITQAAVQGRPMSRAQAQATLASEIALADGAERVSVVSDRDAHHFTAAGHHVTVLSHGIETRRSAPGLASRSGLLFVGALFPDSPNEDGLLWFIEAVMPLLRARLAHPPTLSVVGINQSSRLNALHAPDVELLGPQALLAPFYDRARVFVAPVRFAGGVPIKVIEAAAQGLPVVASAVLARQLDWDQGIDIHAARDAHAFAAGIMRLLQDDDAWQRQQQAAWHRCAERYAPEQFGNMLRHVLATPPTPPTPPAQATHTP